MQHKNPALILSLIIPGNVYPVVEHPRGNESIAGGAIKPGYNSHYVVTDSAGIVISTVLDTNKYDELVVDQECQVLPVFVLSVDVEQINELLNSTGNPISQPPGVPLIRTLPVFSEEDDTRT